MNSLSCSLGKDDLIQELQRIEKKNKVVLMIVEYDVVMGLNAFKRHLYTSWSSSQRYDLIYSRANHKGAVKAGNASRYTIYAFSDLQDVFIETDCQFCDDKQVESD